MVLVHETQDAFRRFDQLVVEISFTGQEALTRTFRGLAFRERLI